MQHGESGRGAEGGRAVPAAVIARLPELLRVLQQAGRSGEHTISSEDLAASLEVSSAMVRKDLSFLGFTGTRGVGYDVAALRYQIESVLDLSADRPVAIVGAGHLGTALAAYPGFAEQGFRIAAIFDSNPIVVGTRIGGATVLEAADMQAAIGRLGIRMAILAVPAAAAQGVADRLVSAGVVSLLNFAPVAVTVPEHVQVRRTDLAAELQILAFHARAAARTAGSVS